MVEYLHRNDGISAAGYPAARGGEFLDHPANITDDRDDLRRARQWIPYPNTHYWSATAIFIDLVCSFGQEAS
jgi:hypothetical protein